VDDYPLTCAWGLCIFFLFVAGGEEGRAVGQSMDSSRHRLSGPILNAGSYSKQKSPVANDYPITKDAVVSCLGFFFFSTTELCKVSLIVLSWWNICYSLMDVEHQVFYFSSIFLQFVLFNLCLLNPINFALISGITESLYFWHGIIRPQFLSATVYSSLLANLTWMFVVMHNLLFLQLLKILFSCICWQCVLLTCMCQNPLFSCCLKSFVDWWYQFIFTAHAFYAINGG
jgi:hypothetical protein